MKRRTRRWRGPALFATVVLAYAGMQRYRVSAAYWGLALVPPYLPLLVVWALRMTFFPFLPWRLERGGWHRLATAGAWFGYTWMGAVFLFFSIALALKGLGAVAAATGALDPAVPGATGSRTFWLAVALTFGVVVYGFFAARAAR